MKDRSPNRDPRCLCVGLLLLSSALGQADQIIAQPKSTGWDFQLTSDEASEPWLIQQAPNLTDWEDLIFFDSRKPGGTTTVATVDHFELADPHASRGFFRAIKLSPAQANARRPYVDNLRKWRLRGPSRYRFVITESTGWFSWTATIEVHDGVVQSAEFTKVSPPVMTPSPITISGIFERLGQAYKEDATTITATWDEDTGYPVSGFIDLSAELSDEERSWTITDFQPLFVPLE